MPPLNTIINADCLEVMKGMPDKCVDLVLTDPPYGINASNGVGRSIRIAIQNGKLSGGDWDSSPPPKKSLMKYLEFQSIK